MSSVKRAVPFDAQSKRNVNSWISNVLLTAHGYTSASRKTSDIHSHMTKSTTQIRTR